MTTSHPVVLRPWDLAQRMLQHGAALLPLALLSLALGMAIYHWAAGLAWPDAFPAGDLIIRRCLGVDKSPAALAAAKNWQPWRAYAVMHLWKNGVPA